MPRQYDTVAVLEAIPGARRRSVIRTVFSFPVMLAFVLSVLAVLTVRSRFNDPDLWWHLKVGEITWNTHKIPTTDLFSFTTNHHPWTAHEWLSQLTIFGAYHAGGYTGLMLWLCLFTAAILIAVYSLCSMYSGNAKIALIGGMIAWFFGTVGFAIRPHMIGYLLLSCELLIVHMARSRDPRWFFCLPPLFAMWINCHGSFILGLAVLGTHLFCSFLNFRSGLLVCSGAGTRYRLILSAALVLSVAALFVNPVGLNQLLYPLNVMMNQKTGLAQVMEWQPLQFAGPRALGLLALSACVLLIPLARRSELFLQELLLLCLGFMMAARHERMLFVFGIFAAPVVCRLLSDAWESYDRRRDRWAPNAAMIAFSIMVIVGAFPTRRDLEQQVEKDNPVKAVEFMRRAGISGRMLNEYVYGGYLIWAAPEHPVFVDGRGDVFDWAGVLDDLGKWSQLQEDPKLLLDKYHIDFCLLSQSSPMTRVLPLLPNWRQIYSDEESVIFQRSSRANNPSGKAD